MSKDKSKSMFSPGAGAVYRLVIYLLIVISISLSILSAVRAFSESVVIIRAVMLVPLVLLALSLIALKNDENSRFQKYFSVFVLGVFYFFGLYTLVNWGLDAPQGLLTLTLASIIHALLFPGAKTWQVYALVSLFYILIAMAQVGGLIIPVSLWRQQSYMLADVVLYLTTITVIFISAWLFNRQQTHSFHALKSAETKITAQNKYLEQRVLQKTQQLRDQYIRRMEDVHQFVLYGKDVSGILHDIVSPITALSIQIEQLQKGKLHRSELQDLRQSVLRINALVSSAKARMKADTNLESIKIEELISEVVATLRHRIQAESIKVDICCKNEQIIVSSNHLYKVLQNLLINSLDACSATNRKAKHVKINCRVTKSLVYLSIIDNGCGIPPKHLKKVFDPFNSIKIPGKGTGLGLSLVREITENTLNGKIQIKSRYREGTEVLVVFPRINQIG